MLVVPKKCYLLQERNLMQLFPRMTKSHQRIPHPQIPWSSKYYLSLAIGRAGHMDAFLVGRHYNERQLLQHNVHNMTLQCDTYLQEMQKALFLLL